MAPAHLQSGAHIFNWPLAPVNCLNWTLPSQHLQKGTNGVMTDVSTKILLLNYGDACAAMQTTNLAATVHEFWAEKPVQAVCNGLSVFECQFEYFCSVNKSFLYQV